MPLLCLWSAATAIAGSPPAFAQPQPAQLPDANQEPWQSTAIITLKAVLQSIQDTQKQIKTKQRQGRLCANRGRKKIKIVYEINEFNKHLDAVRSNFQEIATGADLEAFVSRPKERFNWEEEIQDLFGPIIQELKNMTARPREIEKLRTEPVFYEKQLSIVGKAIESITKSKTGTEEAGLKSQLNNLEKEWNNRE